MKTEQEITEQNVTTEYVIKRIGTKALVKALKVTKQTVSHYKTSGKFPPRGYLVIKRFCFILGIPCPDRLFSFVEPVGELDVSEGSGE
ncbi:MAG: hypothetical protein EP341_00360 [Sphingomonadales bacterium]|nr:MAG: hypothetical protein EP341_00360 [Sphingomonadales bacterium]